METPDRKSLHVTCKRERARLRRYRFFAERFVDDFFAVFLPARAADFLVLRLAVFFDDVLPAFLAPFFTALFAVFRAVFPAAFLACLTGFAAAFAALLFAAFFAALFLATLFLAAFPAAFLAFLTGLAAAFPAPFFAPVEPPDVDTAGTAALRACTANAPPCGSIPTAIQSPPGTCIGPLDTWPPAFFVASAASSTSVTSTYGSQCDGACMWAGAFGSPGFL
jgi:hypothetical protein